MGLTYWFPSLRVFVLGIMCVQLVMHILRHLIDNCAEQTSNMSWTKRSRDRKTFTVSLQHLDSGPWSRHWTSLVVARQARRFMAVCLRWRCPAPSRATITVLSLLLLPRFQSSPWLIGKNCPPLSSPFSHQQGTIKILRSCCCSHKRLFGL